MSDADRQAYMQLITRKLVCFTGGSLALIGTLAYVLMTLSEEAPPVLSVLVFMCGLLGGFVSIQQRLPKMGELEMRALTRSWLSITLIPINGGVFSLVFMFMFMGGMLEGSLFPQYSYQAINNTADFYDWMSTSYPISNHENAKLIFWSFVAGFSERLVPQVIGKVSGQLDTDDNGSSETR
ncbi:MAG: hypothetical protein AAGA11_11870 [Pseudomonadota bacterium]